MLLDEQVRRQQPSSRLILLLLLQLIVAIHEIVALDYNNARINTREINQGRFFISTGSPLKGELLISLPLQIFLPTVAIGARKSRRRMIVENSTRTTTMQQILTTFGIPEDDVQCQKHFVCQLMKHPQMFAPLSTFIYLILREKRRLPWIRKQELKIMEDGLIDMANDQNCSQMFAGCDKSIESLVDLKALKYWQLLAEHTPLTITI
jgi:hypothetical protein